MRIKETKASRIFNVFNIIMMLIVVFITFAPFLNLVAQSFSAEGYITAGEVVLLPKGFNLDTYRAVINNKRFWVHYQNTFIYAIAGTALAMMLTTLLAYVLSKPKSRLKYKSFWVGFSIFTMFFNGGIIPTYILYNNTLNITNTRWAVIFPLALNIFNMLIMKSFFESLPTSLEEAAQVDGMSTYGIFLKIILPLSKPIIATMILFYGVAYWNSWWEAFMFLSDWQLQPISLYLRNVISGALSSGEAAASSSSGLQIASNIQSVAMVLSMLPIIVVYPFVQKYFVSGIMLGAVKE